MRRRHPVPIPRAWLMTDERMGDDLWRALARLPRGGGVVFRHYATPPAERRRLLAGVMRVARRRRLTVFVAGGAGRGHGVHNARAAQGIGRALISRSVHSARDAVAARRDNADVVFVSPVFPTRSHPGARTLGRVRLGLMIRDTPIPVIALGGMTASRLRGLNALGVYGWAGIDAWLD